MGYRDVLMLGGLVQGLERLSPETEGFKCGTRLKLLQLAIVVHFRKKENTGTAF